MVVFRYLAYGCVQIPSIWLCSDTWQMTVRGACSGSPCDNGVMLHSVLLSSASQALPAQVTPAQIPLAASTLVAADPTGLEWLLLVAAPIVFLVLYLVCLFVVAVFGPTVMKNNKSGGTTAPPVWRLGFALWRCGR